jgi:ribonuclease HI
MYYYAVHKGNVAGIFTSWSEAERAITGYSGAIHRRFTDIQAAEHFVRTGDLMTRNIFEKKTVSVKKKPVAPSGTPPNVIPTPSVMPTPSVTPSVIGTPNGTTFLKPVSKSAVHVSQYYSHPDYDRNSGTVHVYTDGSATANGKAHAKGGYGVFIAQTVDIPEKLISHSISGIEKVTNNIGELKAIIKALEQILLLDMDLDDDVKPDWMIHYDSTYAADVITGKKNAKANIELVTTGKELLHRCSKADIKIEFHHVYSHTGNQDLHSLGNAIADTLASRA